MTTIPLISQLKSLFQVCTGDVAGAKKTQEDFYEAWKDHPEKTIGDIADGIPVVGHIKGFVHLALGDKEGFIHSEEAATRTTAVLGAVALTGASGGLAAPILAGVVAGVTADGILTGVESARHERFDPQGLVGVGSNVVRGIHKGKNVSGDIFDGVVIVAGDGLIGASAAKPAVTLAPAGAVEEAASSGVADGVRVSEPVAHSGSTDAVGSTSAVEPDTIKIFRVEGRSLWKEGGTFHSGDNARLFPYKEEVVVRERLPKFGPPEDLEWITPAAAEVGRVTEIGFESAPGNPDIQVGEPWKIDERPDAGSEAAAGSSRPGKPQREVEPTKLIDKKSNLFNDNGISLFLNFGEEDRAYGYYAQKILDHRKAVEEYRQQNPNSTLGEGSHTITVKSFKILTRDIEQVRDDAVDERDSRKKASTNEFPTVEPKRPRDKSGVIKVDPTKAPNQYGLTAARYTPVLNKAIKGSFESNHLYIRDWPSGLLEWIKENPVEFGKVRRIHQVDSAVKEAVEHTVNPPAEPVVESAVQPAVEQAGSSGTPVSPKFLPIAALIGAFSGADQVNLRQEDVVPRRILQCRHVKVPSPGDDSMHAGWSEWYEYLVEFNDAEKTIEWVPEFFVAPDLQKAYYQKTMASAKPVTKFVGREGGKLLVQRPDGTVDKIDERQIFWEEEAPGTNKLHESEVDAILYHLYRDQIYHGQRISLHTDNPFPDAKIAHVPASTDADGNPLYIGSVTKFHGGVHPCKVAPHLPGIVRIPYGGAEVQYSGPYDLLPFVAESMEWVPSSDGKVPIGRKPILGGSEATGEPLYHAMAEIDSIRVPGKAGPQFNGGMFPFGDKEVWKKECDILCWK